LECKLGFQNEEARQTPRIRRGDPTGVMRGMAALCGVTPVY